MDPTVDFRPELHLKAAPRTLPRLSHMFCALTYHGLILPAVCAFAFPPHAFERSHGELAKLLRRSLAIAAAADVTIIFVVGFSLKTVASGAPRMIKCGSFAPGGRRSI